QLEHIEKWLPPIGRDVVVAQRGHKRDSSQQFVVRLKEIALIVLGQASWVHQIAEMNDQIGRGCDHPFRHATLGIAPVSGITKRQKSKWVSRRRRRLSFVWAANLDVPEKPLAPEREIETCIRRNFDQQMREISFLLDPPTLKRIADGAGCQHLAFD